MHIRNDMHSLDDVLKSDGCDVAVGEFMFVNWIDGDTEDVGMEEPL